MWVKLTCSWFANGLICALRGHQWRTWRMGGTEVTTCGCCGQLRGLRTTVEFQEQALRAAASVRAARLAAQTTEEARDV